MKPWIAYVRNSHNEPLTLNAQANAIRAHLAASGLGPVEIVSDIGPTKGSRPGFAQVMRRAKAGDIAGVCVVSIDRLWRNILDLEEGLTVFDERDVKFASVEQAIDTASPIGRFALRLMGAIAQIEAESAR